MLPDSVIKQLACLAMPEQSSNCAQKPVQIGHCVGTMFTQSSPQRIESFKVIYIAERCARPDEQRRRRQFSRRLSQSIRPPTLPLWRLPPNASSAAVNVAPGPSRTTWPANMHARGRRHRDRRTARPQRRPAAAARTSQKVRRNAHANPGLKQDTSTIMVRLPDRPRRPIRPLPFAAGSG